MVEWWVCLIFSLDVIPSEARDLQWNVVPTVAPEDSSPRKLRWLGMTIKLTHYHRRDHPTAPCACASIITDTNLRADCSTLLRPPQNDGSVVAAETVRVGDDGTQRLCS